ncbi:beta-lactamase, precursor [Mycolicibacterium thermoresistibile]|uniref:Beta-lactamase n=1 Tax=Mycolicibacterium thermoresistibile TaxID=1797 RepID=A0A100XH48_MYCTH|nr:beta-lactamase, precursor [Mycolicibacterium thermoresistibile]
MSVTVGVAAASPGDEVMSPVLCLKVPVRRPGGVSLGVEDSHPLRIADFGMRILPTPRRHLISTWRPDQGRGAGRVRTADFATGWRVIDYRR